MGTEPQHCYLDESGSHGFNFSKEGTSTHFVVAGVVIDDTKVSELEKRLGEISRPRPEGPVLCGSGKRIQAGGLKRGKR